MATATQRFPRLSALATSLLSFARWDALAAVRGFAFAVFQVYLPAQFMPLLPDALMFAVGCERNPASYHCPPVVVSAVLLFVHVAIALGVGTVHAAVMGKPELRRTTCTRSTRSSSRSR